jgi:hypothetical protein
MEGDSVYLHVCDKQGMWKSICKVCYQTAAEATSEHGLTEGENRHKCPGPLDSRPYARGYAN